MKEDHVEAFNGRQTDYESLPDHLLDINFDAMTKEAEQSVETFTSQADDILSH